MTDIFDEVSEDLRAERAQRLLQRYGYLLIVAAVLVVAAVGGWKYWASRTDQARAAAADAFMTASRQAGSPADAKSDAKSDDPARASQTLAAMAETGPAGYRTLARLQQASVKARDGDLPAALALWNQVSSDETADPDLRRVADLLWVQHQLDSGEPAIVEGRLAPLLASGPWRPLALECQAWLKLRTGEHDAAVAALKEIVGLPAAPTGVRTRAADLLTQLGEAPVPQLRSMENNG